MAPCRLPQLLMTAPVAALSAPVPLVQPPLPGPVPAQAQAPALLGLDFLGGDEDDGAFARIAAGLVVGDPLTDPGFQTALAAIRRTDRFRQVEGRLLSGPGGVRAQVRLDPWPVVKRVLWQGDARLAAVKKQLRGLRAGMRPGDRRLDAWSRDQQVRLVEAGYPEAQVLWTRDEDDKRVIITVNRGAGTLVRRIEVDGDPAPYTAEEIRSFAQVKPGRTLWTAATQLATARNLRRQLQNRHRLEAQVDLQWDGKETLRINVIPGPQVVLAAEGDGLGWSTALKDLISINRADRYSPELLDEGDRRIQRYFRGKGYLDAQVGHRREVTRSSPPAYQEVTVTYTIHRGEQSRLEGVRFEGNVAFTEAELTAAADLPGGVWSLGRSPIVTPDLLDALESRLKALYMNNGYTEASLRRSVERKDGRTQLVFRIREGPQRLLHWIRLELPAGGFGDPFALGGCLPLIFADQPRRVGGPDQPRTYLSDRRSMAGVQGVLTLAASPAPGDPSAQTVLLFRLSRPIPLQKGDLTRVYTALRQQRLPALGIVRPQVRLNVEAADGGTGIRVVVPAQATEKIQRMVVSGSDKTRARAVLRETQLQPGAVLDTDQLSRAQARLSYLGAFQRVDLRSLADPDGGAPAGPGAAAADHPPVPWKEGDLQLNLEERPPYLITSSFGYDKSQGYHVGLGLQQLNVGGMGRTIDYAIRAGNGTINSKTLARMFPTGTYDRSVDSFTVGYTDPWFAPGVLKSWLPDRTQYRAEAGYIQERQSLYLLRRRRMTNTLQWSLTPQVSFLMGHRWERVDVAAAIPGVSSDELAVLARYPAQTTISAPFAQVARDTRDNAFDPTSGMYSVARVDFANQLFLTSKNSSYVKVDLRNQWTWPVGYKARAGVVALGLRVGVAKPTASSAENLPLSERFFAGGPFSFRGVEPDALGVQTHVPLRYTSGPNVGQIETDANGNPILYATPVGGQGLVLINLEYRFPLLGQGVWGEVFIDSGQVYESLTRLGPTVQADGTVTPAPSPFPPLRTAPGLGLIFKIGGFPIKIEYAADLNRILGRPRSQDDLDTQLKSLLISAGFQF